ncbi:MAG: hypothetical protein SGARI_005939 [Bacillariaceae sp.]
MSTCTDEEHQEHSSSKKAPSVTEAMNDDEESEEWEDEEDYTLRKLQEAEAALEKKLRERKHTLMRNEDAEWIREKAEEIAVFKDSLESLWAGKDQMLASPAPAPSIHNGLSPISR